MVQHALGHRQRQRRERGQLVDQRVDGLVKLAGRDDLGDEPEGERLGGRDAPSPHDRVLGAAEPDQAREALRAARAGDHPELDLGERELDVVGGDTEVAGERQLEPDPEGIAAQLCDHRLGAALGRGDVPGEARQPLRLDLEEAGDVSAGGERFARAREDDEADVVVGAELGEEVPELVARADRDPVQLPWYVERDRGNAAVCVPLEPEPVVVRHRAEASSRRSRRRIFPDGLFGSDSTKRYSRGRLKRASVAEARQKASSCSAVTFPPTTTTATTLWTGPSSAAATTATSATSGCRASTSSTSSGWMFSPAEMIMSSTRPRIQRSPSSSSRPTSPVWYQPSRIAFSSASGRFQ